MPQAQEYINTLLNKFHYQNRMQSRVALPDRLYFSFCHCMGREDTVWLEKPGLELCASANCIFLARW